jgi:hypothetical protein
MAYFAGLTLSCTQLGKEDKEFVKGMVETAGGRCGCCSSLACAPRRRSGL